MLNIERSQTLALPMKRSFETPRNSLLEARDFQGTLYAGRERGEEDLPSLLESRRRRSRVRNVKSESTFICHMYRGHGSGLGLAYGFGLS